MVYNRTSLSEKQIAELPLLGCYKNEWRQRIVSLFRLAPGQVISIGETFKGDKIICQETDQDHKYALSAWENGNFNYRAR